MVLYNPDPNQGGQRLVKVQVPFNDFKILELDNHLQEWEVEFDVVQPKLLLNSEHTYIYSEASFTTVFKNEELKLFKIVK